jgi:hypothetical protein
MDKRKHKFFAVLNPGTKHDTPAAPVDQFKRGNKRPEQKPGNPRSDNYQPCDPSAVHLSKMYATLPASIARDYRKGRNVLNFSEQKTSSYRKPRQRLPIS